MRHCYRLFTGSRNITTASSSGPTMSLREATRLAKIAGCVDSANGSSSSLLRRCTDPACAQDRKVTSSSASWEEIKRRQHQVFNERHLTAENAIAVTVSCVNMAHLSVYVHAVQCGYPASHAPGPSGEGVPGKRTIATATLTNQSCAVLLLWVSMGSPELLAVRCALSPGAVETCWRAAPAAESSDTTKAGGTSQTAAPSSMLSEKDKLRRIKAWAEELTLHRWVVASGQLRMEDVYDGDLQKVVTVPVLEVARDHFKGSVRALPPGFL
ncbi:hypothetical protein, conserved [Leishmania donovani]|uniref:KREPA4, putative n=2 Tax=Leishmania donovani TaxID=5661 RepID=E9BTD4_LEIDO|nr:hypothetical protein, conserved [Leishmania donovani]AYU83418.1 KREPA4, putative [Leishmania donovani]CBZ38513.1 hypothetical protein, conserved [Leishmania donovani]